MPKDTGISTELERQAAKLLELVADEVSRREQEIEVLRGQLSALQGIASLGAAGARPAGRKAAVTLRVAGIAAASAKPKRRGPEVDWDKILTKLPKQFDLSSIAKLTPELEMNRQARVVALARWSRANKIQKLSPGKYAKS